jgi:hypothetical protein
LGGGTGQALVVGVTEAGVFVQSGQVLGMVGPGTHLVDPRAMPFLQPVAQLADVDALVVTLAVHGVRIRGATGEIFDAASGLALSPRIFGEVGVRIVDAARAALVAASVPTGDADGTLRGHIQHATIESAKTVLIDAGKDGRLVRLLTDRAAHPELSDAIAAAARAQLAGLGVEITAFGSVVVALSEEDMGKVNALDATAPMGPVYEMLWDCRFCGQKKLLGLTHRHCPNCGAPQNADARYFPSDADKVPAKEHEYFGADLRCTHCGVANGKNSKHCAGCGAPLERAPEIARREDQLDTGAGFASVDAAPAHTEPAVVTELPTAEFVEPVPGVAGPAAQAATAPPRAAPATARAVVAQPPKGRSTTRTVLRAGCLVVLVVVALVVALAVWKKPGGLSVTGHTWKREIAVERYGAVSDSAWCDQMPFAARSVTRHKEVRSHEKIEDGQDCHTRRVDRGNGTFAEQQECTPKYRDEPVYSDRCSFTVDRWTKTRSETAQGTSVNDAPKWPATSLTRPGTCEGCEREGARTETYTVTFRDDGAREHTCDVDQTKWTSFADGSQWKGAMTVVGGALDCGSLAAP